MAQDFVVFLEFVQAHGAPQEVAQAAAGGHLHALAGQVAGPLHGPNHHLFGAGDGFVQVHLPVHQPAAHQKILDRVHGLFLEHQPFVVHAQHFYEAVGPGAAFFHAGVKRVAVEVIEPVHVELAAHELVKEGPAVGALKHVDGQIQPAAELRVQALHDEQRELLVRHVLKNSRFQGVRERAVAHVVEQNGGQRRFALGRRNFHAFVLERAQGQRHEVHGAQRVVEARMQRPRVHEAGEPELLNAPQPLKVPVLNEVEEKLRRDSDEAVDRVVENFLFVHTGRRPGCGGPWAVKPWHKRTTEGPGLGRCATKPPFGRTFGATGGCSIATHSGITKPSDLG